MPTTVPLSLSTPPSSSLINPKYPFSLHLPTKFSLSSSSSPYKAFPTELTRSASLSNSLKSGICGASQAVDLYPSSSSVSPEIVVREARIEDSWEVAETHCSSFFPEYSFPLDLALRVDRLVSMVSGFTVPHGCKRTCLVAVVGSSVNNDKLFFGSEEFRVGDFEAKFSSNKGGYVAGILTLDTVADFLPRKGPLRQRRE